MDPCAAGGSDATDRSRAFDLGGGDKTSSSCRGAGCEVVVDGGLGCGPAVGETERCLEPRRGGRCHGPLLPRLSRPVGFSRYRTVFDLGCPWSATGIHLQEHRAP